MEFLTDRKEDKFGKGRNIDPALAELEGEGAQQKIRDVESHPARKGYGVWDKLPSSSFNGDTTYYNMPLLKEPVWTWSIPAYFYIGGAAGASAMLGASAQVLSPKAMKRLIRKSRYLTMGGIAAGTVLLIYDLGRKSRFLNMLRVFRPTSPMNMGSWILTFTGFFTTASLIYGGDNKLFKNKLLNNNLVKNISAASGIDSGIFGILLAGYTGVLLNFSAVPIWQEAGKTLPLLFMASGISGASATLQLMKLNRKEEAVVHTFSIAGMTSELLAAQALELEVKDFPQVRKTLHEGQPGKLWRAGKLFSLAALVLSLLPGKSKPKKIVSAVLEGAGAMSMRFAIYKAGQASARDPRSLFELQQHRKPSAETARLSKPH